MIYYPSLTFPPINLWSIPYQNINFMQKNCTKAQLRPLNVAPIIKSLMRQR